MRSGKAKAMRGMMNSRRHPVRKSSPGALLRSRIPVMRKHVVMSSRVSLCLARGVDPVRPSASVISNADFSRANKETIVSRVNIVSRETTVISNRAKSGFKGGLRRREKPGLERGQEAPRHRHVRAASSPASPGCCSSWPTLLGRRLPKCDWLTCPSIFSIH